MQKGPLVYAAMVLAAFLMAVSFLLAAFPDDAEVFGIIGGVAVVLVFIVLVLILLKTRRGEM